MSTSNKNKLSYHDNARAILGEYCFNLRLSVYQIGISSYVQSEHVIPSVTPSYNSKKEILHVIEMVSSEKSKRYLKKEKKKTRRIEKEKIRSILSVLSFTLSTISILLL